VHALDRHGHIMSLLLCTLNSRNHYYSTTAALLTMCMHSARQHQLFTRCTHKACQPACHIYLARRDNPTTIKLIKPSMMTLQSSMVGDKPSLRNTHKGACCTQDCIA